MARTPKLTPERSEQICREIRLGMGSEAAALLSGIKPRTFHLWREKGRDGGRAIYVQFLHDSTRAELERERALVADVRAAGIGREATITRTKEVLTKSGEVATLTETETRTDRDWRASAWLLERLHADRYAKRAMLEHSGPDGGPIEVEERHYVEVPTDVEALGKFTDALRAANLLDDPED